MNEYGCNPTEVAPVLETWVNHMVDNFTVPTDPCLFDTINVTQIWDQIEINQDDDTMLQALHNKINEQPCQIWIDPSIFKTFIEPYNKTFLIDHDYWFGENGKCNVTDPHSNDYDIILIPCDKNCSYRYTQCITFLFCFVFFLV